VTDPAIPMPPRRLRSPYWHRDTHSLYVGDAREVLAEMPDRPADCIVTSPALLGQT
jgi:DNA modification methylase